MTGGRPVDWVRRSDLQRSTFLELFFDLVFVLALTQLSQTLFDHLNWSGAYRTLLLIMAVWWTWAITTWVTDLYEYRPALQVLVLTAMLGVLVMSTSVQRAYASQGLVFAAGYVAIHVGRGLVLAPALRGGPIQHRPVRILLWFMASAPLWLAGGFAHGPVRVTLWTVAVVLDYGAGAAGWPVPHWGRTADSEWSFGAEHISERYRQMFIIGLGDTILTMGLTYTATPSTPARAAALVCSFLTTVLIWLIYFRFAAQLLASSFAAVRSGIRLARTAVFHHLLMVTGIVLTAVGNKVTIRAPFEAERPGWVLPIVGGPALFLFGRILFGRLVIGHVSPSRVTGLVCLAVLMPFALLVPPLAATTATAAILTFTLLPSLFPGLARLFHEPMPEPQR